MDDSLAITKPNNQTNSLVVKEDKKKVAKIWKKVVNMGTTVEKAKIKTTPFMLKVASVFVPELAPILLPLSKFMKSKSGKKWMEGTTKGIDAAGDLLTGKTEEAKAKINENIDFLNSEEGTEYLNDVKNTVGGMVK